MSENPVLKELSEAEMLKEVARREHRRLQGKCDYCDQVPSAKNVCRFPLRHTDPRIRKHAP